MWQDFRRSAHDWDPPHGREAIPESEKPIQRTIGIRNFHMRSPWGEQDGVLDDLTQGGHGREFSAHGEG
jgi:hypothetical protein